MKILGEKSLSSKVIIGLNILFILISVIDVIVSSIIAKILHHIIMNENMQSNVFDLTLYIMIIITGMIALIIIYEFIKIFKNLKNSELFCEDNAKRLNIISNNCFVISIIYFAIVLFVFWVMRALIEEFVYYISGFAIVLMVIFSVSGIGIKILNEIYKKAIEYKDENEFTI